MSEQDKNIITLTDRASDHVKNFLAKQDGGVGLRVAVKPTGCSGHQYVVEKADAILAQDISIECDGFKVVVDEQSLRYLQGTELDFVTEGLNSGFRFNNPNVADTCGCGESFTINDGNEPH